MHRRLNRENGEIRLFRLNLEDQHERHSATEGNSFSLHLEHHQHGKTPYIALSYVWGDADNQVPILVNNVKLLVRQNLNLALAKLRQERPEAWIWVDAICIDQAHDDEKSWEVNRMRDVFQKAETVFHWLGPAADDSDFLLDWVADLGREASEADVLGFVAMSPNMQEQCLLRVLGHEHTDAVPKAMLRDSSSADMTTEGLDDSTSTFPQTAAPFLVQLATQHPPNLSSYRMSKAMEALLQRPFFQRLWIVQELAVSQNGVFLCDSRQLPVDYLESVLALTNRRLPEQTSRILDDLIAKANCDTTSHRWLGGFNRNLIDNPGLMVRRRRHQGDFPSLLSILKCSIATFEMPIFATADPRDLVFGLLGICRDASSLNLRVDYTKSIVQVFTTVTRAFIHNDKEYCLGFSTFPKDLDGLPSWVPDWHRMCREGVPFFPVSYGFPRFKASLDTQQPPERSVGGSNDSPTLLLSGFRLGSVTSVMDKQLIRSPKESLTSEIVKFCYESGITNDETIIRTCLMDNTLFGAASRTDSTFLRLARKVFHGQKYITKEDLNPQATTLLSRYDRLRDEREGALDPPIQQQFTCFSSDLDFRVRNFLREKMRTLFVTDAGMLGLGPSEIQKEDFIAILLGHKAPVVLHQVEDGQCSFVGEVYVDGVMDGEAMEEGKVDRENFKIV